MGNCKPESLLNERRPEERKPVFCLHLDQRPVGDQESKDLSSSGLEVRRALQRIRRSQSMVSYVFL